MNNTRALLPVLLALSLPGFSQNLPKKFEDNRSVWEESLAKGVSAPVRKAAEAILLQEGPAVNPADYNAMHAMVAMQGLAARSCVLEGAWEDAVSHLQKAVQAASDNASTADLTFQRIRRQHQDNLKVWRAEQLKLEQRLQDLDAQGGLTSEQIKTRTQVRAQLDEYRNATTSSERSLVEIDNLMSQLRKERETYTASLSEWQGFLATEKGEIARKGSLEAYVAEKIEQVKGDDAKPLPERLAYARRLIHLSPTNPDSLRLANGLSGKDVEPASAKPQPKPKAVAKKKRKSRG